MKPSNRMIFTESNVLTLPMKRKQYRVWDGGKGRGADPVARGLCILVSPAGAKSYRSTYYFPGSPKAHSRHLGRVGEMSLDEARKQCRADRAKASSGVDPKVSHGSDEFEATVKEYIKREQVGARKNVSAPAVERLLLRECAEWKRRPVGSIIPREIQALLELTRDGNDTQARQTLSRELPLRPAANVLHMVRKAHDRQASNIPDGWDRQAIPRATAAST